MNQTQQAKAAKKFVENWIGHGYEKGESQKFWIDLLTTTNVIDAYILSTRVMIEQKLSYKDLYELNPFPYVSRSRSNKLISMLSCHSELPQYHPPHLSLAVSLLKIAC